MQNMIKYFLGVVDMNIVIKVNDETKKKMIEYYKDKKREKTPPYALFQAMEEDTIITLYESGKAMFQGVSADIDANMWKEMNVHLEKEKKINNKGNYYYTNAIGSDEVGTGDYYGPIVVTSAYVNKEDISFLEFIGLKDSKKMTDEKIIEIIPQVINRIKYASIILNNKEYNEKYSSNINMNKIKAILHNKVLNNIIDKYQPDYNYIIVDEFASAKNYFSYLKDVPTVIKNITFLTKGEDKNLAVACASVISRYIFLKEYEKLNKEVNMVLPKGASDIVDKVGKEIVQKYGEDILKDIAKYNFKNTDKILKDNQ
jgi:ribonuclease HIII